MKLHSAKDSLNCYFKVDIFLTILKLNTKSKDSIFFLVALHFGQSLDLLRVEICMGNA